MSNGRLRPPRATTSRTISRHTLLQGTCAWLVTQQKAQAVERQLFAEQEQMVAGINAQQVCAKGVTRDEACAKGVTRDEVCAKGVPPLPCASKALSQAQQPAFFGRPNVMSHE